MLYQKALDMRRAVLPANHPEIAASLVHLGQFWVETGRADQAEPLLLEGHEILQNRLGDAHWQTVGARGLLGLCYVMQGRFEAGEPLLHAAYAHFNDAFGEQDWRTQRTLQALTRMYQAWGKPAKAAAWHDSLRTASPLPAFP